MIPTFEQKQMEQVTWEQRLLKNASRSKAALKPEYQELKFTLHRKLLDKINLHALATIDDQRVRGEVRQALISSAAAPAWSEGYVLQLHDLVKGVNHESRIYRTRHHGQAHVPQPA